MSRYSRTELADMTVAEIKQFCRDNSITGYSRYTRKTDLVEYVYWTLDSIEEMLEENLLEAPTEEMEGDRTETLPGAIASTQIYPDLPPVSQTHPDPSQVSEILSKTDQSESPALIPESSQTHADGMNGVSPGYPASIPRAYCEYPRVMPGLCPGYANDINRISSGHDPGMIDRYPKSSHGINSAVPGSRIQQPLTQCVEVGGLSQ